jgi:hypothetical protein
MAALAIGMMVIIPFISHAGTNLIGSRAYAESIAHRSAADAGVEHALWSLTKGTFAGLIPDTGDEITYQLDESLNGDIISITVTTNITGSSGGTGMIDNIITDSLIFDTTLGNYPAIISVGTGIYAVAYQGPSSRGYLKTVAITAAGDIGATTIDSLNFDTGACSYPDIINVGTGMYAIAYQGTSNRGYLKTVAITAAGDIAASVTDTLIFDSNTGREPVITNVSGTMYAIAYRGASNRGYLKTVAITAAGDIAASVTDSLTFDSNAGYYPDIIRVGTGMFAIAYRGASNRGTLVTVAITAAGDIAASTTDSLVFDSSACSYPDIILISGTIYAIAYQGSSNDGTLKTVAITAAGDIAASVTDSLIFDSGSGLEPVMIFVSGDIYAIAYRNGSNLGVLVTVSVTAAGDIATGTTDSLTFDTSSGYYPDIIQVGSGMFAIAYTGPTSRGYLKTVGIGAGTEVTSAYRIVSTAGGNTIRAFVNIAGSNTTANVTIVSWQVE